LGFTEEATWPALVTVEGTALPDGATLVVWNPIYRLEKR
jgi:hypothetical protein